MALVERRQREPVGGIEIHGSVAAVARTLRTGRIRFGQPRGACLRGAIHEQLASAEAEPAVVGGGIVPCEFTEHAIHILAEHRIGDQIHAEAAMIGDVGERGDVMRGGGAILHGGDAVRSVEVLHVADQRMHIQPLMRLDIGEHRRHGRRLHATAVRPAVRIPQVTASGRIGGVGIDAGELQHAGVAGQIVTGDMVDDHRQGGAHPVEYHAVRHPVLVQMGVVQSHTDQDHAVVGVRWCRLIGGREPAAAPREIGEQPGHVVETPCVAQVRRGEVLRGAAEMRMGVDQAGHDAMAFAIDLSNWGTGRGAPQLCGAVAGLLQ